MTAFSVCPTAHTRKRIALIDYGANRIKPFQSASHTVIDWGKITNEEVLAQTLDKAQLDDSSQLIRRIVASGEDSIACAVYVVQVSDMDVCKVGISCDPVARFNSHQTSNWSDLTLHSVLWVYDNKFRMTEAAVLKAAKEMDCHLRGEWVNMPPDETAMLVVKAARFAKAKASGSAAFLSNIGRFKPS